MLSARNQLPATVLEVHLGDVMAEVILDLNGQDLVAVITRQSALSLGLTRGDSVKALIKATDVLIEKSD
jgi:molybdate transport system regulatory protein